MSACPKCRAWSFDGDRHRCQPAWRVWCPEDGATEDDARIVNASGAEYAAEEWAAATDRDGDYLIVSGRSEPVVHVRSVDGGKVFRFRVSGESVPQYTAEEAEDESPPPDAEGNGSGGAMAEEAELWPALDPAADQVQAND